MILEVNVKILEVFGLSWVSGRYEFWNLVVDLGWIFGWEFCVHSEII